jgi:hypothetical protein
MGTFGPVPNHRTADHQDMGGERRRTDDAPSWRERVRDLEQRLRASEERFRLVVEHAPTCTTSIC